VRAALRRVAASVVFVAGAWSCVEIGTEPTRAAAVELPPFPSPSIVVGDSLRDVNGNAAQITAIVRNIRGEVIDAPVRFLYADFNRDSALAVDSLTGFVRAVKVAKGEARIAVRVGSTLQVLRSIIVTTRPDTIGAADTVAAVLVTVLPDTARASTNPNKSNALTVTVRHFEGTTASSVYAWPVQFEVIKPANPTNDTTAAAWMVDDNGRASALDTSDAAGTAARRVRVRAALFPAAGTAQDTVIVRAMARYRGKLVPDSALRFLVPVRRGGT
jgi:hypothetical protein